MSKCILILIENNLVLNNLSSHKIYCTNFGTLLQKWTQHRNFREHPIHFYKQIKIYQEGQNYTRWNTSVRNLVVQLTTHSSATSGA